MPFDGLDDEPDYADYDQDQSDERHERPEYLVTAVNERDERFKIRSVRRAGQKPQSQPRDKEYRADDESYFHKFYLILLEETPTFQ